MSTTFKTVVGAVLLILSGSYIWLHSLRWWRLDADSIFLLGSFLLIYYLGKPWSLKSGHTLPSGTWPLLFLSLALYAVGIIGTFSWLMAIGWTVSFYCFVHWRFSLRDSVQIRHLMPFAFFAFPWIALDGQVIGWYLRISGAAANEWLFSIMGLDVLREGVNMVVGGVLIRVTEECAGLNALQAMMVSGGFLAFHFFSRSRLYWPAWMGLICMAWISNTLRIFFLGVGGLTFGVDFATGPFHDWGGLVAITTMFVITAVSFSILSQTVLQRD